LVIIIVATVFSTIVFSRFDWFKRNEHVALWLEGVALVFIFGLDYFNRLDEAKEEKRAHEETLEQLQLLRQQTQATSESAIAAKKSADLTAALHRPYMGISSAVSNTANGRYWDIVFMIRNFGTLPAIDVGFAAEYFIDSGSRGKQTAKLAVQVFPDSTHHARHRFDTGLDGPSLIAGKMKLEVKVFIPYKTQENRLFEYSADLCYVDGQFRIDISNTVEKQ
jgi:hypothetical protein